MTDKELYQYDPRERQEEMAREREERRQKQTVPTCGACGYPMTRADSKIHPELFLHDRCLPDELKGAGRQPVAAERAGVETVRGLVRALEAFHECFTGEDWREEWLYDAMRESIDVLASGRALLAGWEEGR